MASLLSTFGGQYCSAMPAVNQIFSFANTFIENLHVLSNGTLLLSTIASAGLLYTLDPTAAMPEAKQVTSFRNGTTGLSGIVSLAGDDLYAVSGGLHTHFAFENDTMNLFIMSLKTNTIVNSIPVPDTTSMDGLAVLPYNPHVALSGDSIGGRILRIDMRTSAVSPAFEDAALGSANSNSPSVPPLGVNGLRTRGNHLYFTNSGQGTFARVLIDGDGNKAGEVETLALFDGIPDDFTFDAAGNVYVAVHPSSVVKITPDGLQTTIASGSLFKEPTSVALANDGKSIFVSTGGTTVGNTTYGGQIIQVRLG